MTGEEIKRIVPDLLDARHPGRSREVAEGVEGELGWILELDGTIALVRASQATHPFIWIRGGIAHAVPRSEALALEVAAGNKDLMVGRMYVAYGDDIAMVVFDEAISAAYLSFDHEASIQDLVTRFETSLEYTADWSTKIRQKFGGQTFTADDWPLMAF